MNTDGDDECICDVGPFASRCSVCSSFEELSHYDDGQDRERVKREEKARLRTLYLRRQAEIAELNAYFKRKNAK